MTSSKTSEPGGQQMDNRYLIFSLDTEFFGIPIAKVREIIRHETITAIHDVVHCVRGVINLRGKIITIFDLRERFGLQPRPYDKYTVFIICEILAKSGHTYMVGMAVDAVQQVELIQETAVKNAADLGLAVSSEYLKGMVKTGLGLAQLIEIDRIVQDMNLPPDMARPQASPAGAADAGTESPAAGAGQAAPGSTGTGQ